MTHKKDMHKANIQLIACEFRESIHDKNITWSDSEEHYGYIFHRVFPQGPCLLYLSWDGQVS